MGLDISLYSLADVDAYQKRYSVWDKDEAGNYPAETMTEEEKQAHLDANPVASGREVPSVEFPTHMCGRSYLRSSYNSGGFNRVVNQMLGTDHGDFYWIFEPLNRDWRSGDEGNLTKDDLALLKECAERALSVAKELTQVEPYGVITVGENAFAGPSKVTDDQALVIFREEAARNAGIDGWYGSIRGDFFPKDPPAILAAISGSGVLGTPVVHLIYRRTDMDYYVQAAKIAAEFCEEAIMLITRDGGAQISWSG